MKKTLFFVTDVNLRENITALVRTYLVNVSQSLKVNRANREKVLQQRKNNKFNKLKYRPSQTTRSGRAAIREQSRQPQHQIAEIILTANKVVQKPFFPDNLRK